MARLSSHLLDQQRCVSCSRTVCEFVFSKSKLIILDRTVPNLPNFEIQWNNRFQISFSYLVSIHFTHPMKMLEWTYLERSNIVDFQSNQMCYFFHLSCGHLTKYVILITINTSLVKTLSCDTYIVFYGSMF